MSKKKQIISITAEHTPRGLEMDASILLGNDENGEMTSAVANVFAVSMTKHREFFIAMMEAMGIFLSGAKAADHKDEILDALRDYRAELNDCEMLECTAEFFSEKKESSTPPSAGFILSVPKGGIKS